MEGSARSGDVRRLQSVSASGLSETVYFVLGGCCCMLVSSFLFQVFFNHHSRSSPSIIYFFDFAEGYHALMLDLFRLLMSLFEALSCRCRI